MLVDRNRFDRAAEIIIHLFSIRLVKIYIRKNTIILLRIDRRKKINSNFILNMFET